MVLRLLHKSFEIIDIFVNLCLENEEMHFIIAQVCKKWSRQMNKELLEKVNCKWLGKEFKANGPIKIRGSTEFRFPLHDVSIAADGMK